ncbi:DUF5362 family protein [Chryseobacterium sp. RG1]|uniref:DUF5362 family protein n=1 Tax=Chryseobacterium tagetis TaxID=2801334 RepID=A0ABS8A433_9FLAO|nr:DUF5362 family protein [Chryseobacterium tagetis]MCA6068093.1 DUF5362 family protein [Chryseobacterium tagetis]
MMETNSPFEQFEELRIDRISREFLTETAKWANFLSILGFIGLGLMVLVALFMFVVGASNSFMPLGSGVFVGIFYILIAGFYFVPINYLYKFSSNMKDALRTNNQASLTSSFEYIKSHYKFIGILTIVIMGIYILMILWGMFAAFGRVI